jgi:hypothetical protein
MYQVTPGVRKTEYFYSTKVIEEIEMTSQGYVVTITVPVNLRMPGLQLYHILLYELPILTSDPETYLTVKLNLRTEYLVWNSDHTQYSAMTREKLDNCLEIQKFEWNCPYVISVDSRKKTDCVTALFHNRTQEINQVCSIQVIARETPLSTVIERIESNLYFIIMYDQQEGAWEIDCLPDRKTVVMCNLTCILQLPCDCIAYRQEEHLTTNYTVIRPRLQACSPLEFQLEQIGENIAQYAQGYEAGLYSINSEQVEEEMRNWTAQFEVTPKASQRIAVKTAGHSLTLKQAQALTEIKIDKQARDKFDPNKYYGKDTPPVGGPGAGQPVWVTGVIIGAITLASIMLLCCLYKCLAPILRDKCRATDVETMSDSNVHVSHQSPHRRRARSRSRERTPSRDSEDIEMAYDSRAPRPVARRRSRRDWHELQVQADIERQAASASYRRSCSHPRTNRESLESLNEQERIQAALSDSNSSSDRGRQRAQSAYDLYYTPENCEIMNYLINAGGQGPVTIQPRGAPCRYRSRREDRRSGYDQSTPRPESFSPRPEGENRPTAYTSVRRPATRPFSMMMTLVMMVTMMSPEVYGRPLQEIVHAKSILADRSWFLFGLNTLYALIGLVLLIGAIRKVCGRTREVRYHLVLWTRKVFRLNIDTTSTVYLEWTNYKDAVYVPVMYLNVVPSSMYYMKAPKKEPKIKINEGWLSSKIVIEWEDNCLVIHRGKQPSLYFSLPRICKLPWNTTWLGKEIIKEPYVTNLVIRHPHTFCERMAVINIPDSSKEAPIKIARRNSKRGDRSPRYVELHDRCQPLVHVPHPIKPTAPPLIDEESGEMNRYAMQTSV